jgi:hypothetical protein
LIFTVASVLRITRAGVAASIAAGLIGWAGERARFGATDDAALERVQVEIRDRLDAAADTLATIASRLTISPDRLRATVRDPSAIRQLFDEASGALRDEPPGRTGVTIYGVDGAPLAWAGRVFDLPKERLAGPPAWFVAPGAIGPRLIHVQPIADRAASPRAAPRGGAIVAEYSLPTEERAAGSADTFIPRTSIVPVTLRPGVAVRPPRRVRSRSWSRAAADRSRPRRTCLGWISPTPARAGAPASGPPLSPCWPSPSCSGRARCSSCGAARATCVRSWC